MKPVNAYVIPGIPQSLEFVADCLQAETPDEVLEAFSKQWDVPVEDIISPSRRRRVSLIRHASAFILKRKFKLSCREISTMLNRRNHATTINSIRAIQDLWDTDPEVRNQLIQMI